MQSLLLLMFAIFLHSLSPCNAENPASFGEHCNKSVLCDLQSSLTCRNGTCLCLLETDMFYDRSLNKCVFLAGKPCLSQSRSHDNPYSQKNDEHVCVKNAQCNLLDGHGFCRCKSGFLETSVGQCVSKKGYNENCDGDEECNTNLNLFCIEGKCMCNETEAFFHMYYGTGTCLGKPGTICKNYRHCVPNADASYCGNERGWKCKCRDSFATSNDGLCLGIFDKPCDPIASPCIDGLTCIDAKCQCPFPSYQKYDPVKRKCRSNVNGPCLETLKGKLINFECIVDAECRSDYGYPECLCKNGYVKSKGGKCKKIYGSSCDNTQECDPIPGLICKEGNCSCPELQAYDTTLNKCVGLWGAKCGGDLRCAGNAFCQTERNNDPESDFGICRCSNGTKVNPERKCVRDKEDGRKYVQLE